jgi:hypothetical protein
MKLEPKRQYSLKELVTMKVFGEKTRLETAARMVVEDKLRSRPVLDAEIRGEGKMRRYYILGARAAAYLKTKAK